MIKRGHFRSGPLGAWLMLAAEESRGANATSLKSEVSIQLPVAEQSKINREIADTYHRYHIDAIETEENNDGDNELITSINDFIVARFKRNNAMDYLLYDICCQLLKC